jgi:hypothetical protein
MEFLHGQRHIFIAVCENHKEQTNTLRGLNADCFSVLKQVVRIEFLGRRGLNRLFVT